MTKGGEQVNHGSKQDSQNQLRSPMTEGGEQVNQRV